MPFPRPFDRRPSPELQATAARRVARLAVAPPPVPPASRPPQPGRPDSLPHEPGPRAAARPMPEPDGVTPGRAHRRERIRSATVAALIDRLPPTLRRGRTDLELRAVVALGLVALMGLAMAGGYLWRARPQAVPVPVRAQVLASPTPTGAVLVIDVEGLVIHPGVVRLPAGSRVMDAVRAAGGARPGTDTSGLNLARLLVDGEQVYVGRPPPSVGGGSGGATPGDGRVDLNSATLEQLDGLPGVGPVLAQRIVDWREEHGRFSAVEELQEVPGIGPAKYAALAKKVRV